MVELMTQLNLQKNDTVAVLMTGSMPGANIAVLTALKSLSVVPVTITSVGASQWGANHIDFTWLDMEKILYNNNLITNDCKKIINNFHLRIIMKSLDDYIRINK